MDADFKSLISEDSPRALPDRLLPGGLKLLVLAPHPDDFDAIGVTLRFFSRNRNTIDAGVARTGGGVEEAYRPGLSLADKADLREGEQQRSIRFFGLPENGLTFLSLANDSEDESLDTPGNCDVIEKFLIEKAPDIVFLPHGNDTNRGHRVMYSLLKQAAPQAGRPFAAFLNRDPKTIEMRTDLYMPFGQDEADWKAELLRFHDSQHQRNLRTRGHGFDARVLDFNRKTARELSLAADYAEAFEIELFNQLP